jgi:hypothetical protein
MLRTSAADWVGLLGSPRSIGEHVQHTGSDAYAWDEIYTIVGDTLGVTAMLVDVA